LGNEARVFRKYLVGPEDERERVALHSVRDVAPDQLLEIHCPGGGGVGDPLQRDPQAVLADVRSGLLSPEAARRQYGVAVSINPLAVDPVHTASLRGDRVIKDALDD
jgi:N-methylhydantoinase B